MDWFIPFVKNAANQFLASPPSKVIEVSATSYSTRTIYKRDEQSMLLLYLPATNDADGRFEVALQSTQKIWSLYRCETRDAAELWFIRFVDKVPNLVTASKDNSLAFLQRICDTIAEHTSWNMAHLAVKLQLTECFADASLKTALHQADPLDGMTPLQLAVETENIKIIKTLLTEGVAVDHCDLNGNSVLHYAACTNKKIIILIAEKSKNMLNRRNSQGQTPLHVACTRDKRECVMALLELGADVNVAMEGEAGGGEPGLLGDSFQKFNGQFSKEDIKYGGTPLHWACSQEVIDALVDKKCDITVLNFQRRTALHMMVMRLRFDCVVCLLGYGADTAVRDMDGNTPLRIAVQKLDSLIVKALITFNADIHELNDLGHSLRHGIKCGQATADDVLWVLHSVGVKRCAPGVRGCTPGCNAIDSYDGLPPLSLKTSDTRATLNLLLEEATTQRNSIYQGRLLCLDGGGIRGLILIVILMELEKAVGAPIIHCFDWVAGTSTGGILSLALARGKPLQECLNLYFKLKNTVFVGTRPYPREPLEKILVDTFGEDTTMLDIEHPRMMITATLADRQPVDLHLFRNYPSPSDILSIPLATEFCEPKPAALQKLWEAARASGAAPSYFKAAGAYVDGGLISNNPTLDAMTEIHEFNAAMRAMGRIQECTPLSLVVSLGTGSVPQQDSEAAMSVLHRWGNISDFLNISMLSIASVKGIGQIMTMLVDQATQADGRVVDRARAWCSSLGVPYYRLCPMLSKEVALNETQNDKLVNMMWETRAYMHSKMNDLQDLIAILKQPVRRQN